MTPKNFKALVVHETEPGTFTHRIEEREIDSLPAGDLLVRVHYSSLNYKDALSASGNRGVTRRYPHTPGIDAAGVVAESASPLFHAGDEVIVSGFDLGMNKPGGFGQYVRVPAGWAVRKPAGLTLAETMIYGTAGFTAAQCIERLLDRGLKADDGKILVTGATGGVGSMAVAILAKLGFTVTAATGKTAEEPFLRDLGAAEVLARDKAVDTSGRALLKEKWAGVVDTVGGDILATAIKSTRYSGTVTCCGNAASPDLPLTVYPFILRGVSLIGIDSAQCPTSVREVIWEKLAGPWRPEKLAGMAEECTLTEITSRIDAMLRGRIRGRVVVTLG